MAFKFTKLTVFPYILAGKYHVEWAGEGAGDFTFQVLWGPDEYSPQWTPVGQPIKDLDTLVEVPQRLLNTTDLLWFKVVATDDKGNSYESVPTNDKFVPERQDIMRYREMLRRFNLELRKFTGSEGWLFRLKTFGEPAQNVHPILGTPIGSEAQDSYGQKFKGGYWPKIHMWVAYFSEPPDGTPDMPVEEQGLTEKTTRVFLAMPYPMIKPQDLWISEIYDVRYKVVSVDPVEFVGLRIKQKVTVTRLPVTDPAYKVPLR